MTTSPSAFPILLALLFWQPADADTIYKSVDSAGQVTYSSTPPPATAQIEKLEEAARPTDEDIRQAKDRAKREEEQVRELEAKRLEQEAAQAAKEARLREMQPSPPPVVIEKPVYIPQTIYYPPAIQRPPGLPTVKPRPAPQDR
jgi:hypothetical protein